jgi:hypothetical protein
MRVCRPLIRYFTVDNGALNACAALVIDLYCFFRYVLMTAWILVFYSSIILFTLTWFVVDGGVKMVGGLDKSARFTIRPGSPYSYLMPMVANGCHWYLCGIANGRKDQRSQVIRKSIYSPRSVHRNQVVLPGKLLHTCSHLEPRTLVRHSTLQ